MYGSRRCLELLIGGYRASVPCADMTLNIGGTVASDGTVCSDQNPVRQGNVGARDAYRATASGCRYVGG